MITEFAALYQEHSRDLYRFALFLGGDPALADDIVSETFVRLWSARERVDFSTVRGYLFTIARNLFLQERRRTRPVALVDETIEDSRPGPESEALSRSELSSTLAALQQLSEIDRAALLMHIDGGLPYEEIATALGVTATTARVKVHRARLKLAVARAQGSHFPARTENRP